MKAIALALSLLITAGCAGQAIPDQFRDLPQLPVESVLYFAFSRGRCSAVAIEPGVALTAGHCVDGYTLSYEQPGSVNTYSMERWDVVSADRHPDMDMAVIHVAGNPAPMPYAAIATELPARGDVVYLVGYGCSSYDPNLPMVRMAAWTGALDVDKDWPVLGPVCPGDSGGALFNHQGELLGIIRARGPGIGYIVPAGYSADLLP